MIVRLKFNASLFVERLKGADWRHQLREVGRDLWAFTRFLLWTLAGMIVLGMYERQSALLFEIVARQLIFIGLATLSIRIVARGLLAEPKVREFDANRAVAEQKERRALSEARDGRFRRALRRFCGANALWQFALPIVLSEMALTRDDAGHRHLFMWVAAGWAAATFLFFLVLEAFNAPEGFLWDRVGGRWRSSRLIWKGLSLGALASLVAVVCLFVDRRDLVANESGWENWDVVENIQHIHLDEIDVPSHLTLRAAPQITRTFRRGGYVTLSRHTQAAVHNTLSSRQLVLLTGSAYVSIPGGILDPGISIYPSQELVIYIQTARMKRTEFAVSDDDGAVDLVVKQGGDIGVSRWAYDEKTGKRGKELWNRTVRAGEHAVIKGGDIHVQELSASEMEDRLAWEKGELRFRGAPLKEVVRQVNRFVSGTLEIGDHSIDQTPVTGVFSLKPAHAREQAAIELARRGLVDPVIYPASDEAPLILKPVNPSVAMQSVSADTLADLACVAVQYADEPATEGAEGRSNSTYDIPACHVGEAMLTFAQRGEFSYLIDGDVQHIKANPLKGKYDIEPGLAALLAHTGCTYAVLRPLAYSIRCAKRPADKHSIGPNVR